VEGSTDVIQLYQAGIHNVVSSSGTALTSDQIRLVNRLTKNITVLFDGDAAGLRASLRGVDLILEQGMNVKICTFPEGEDPDSFARSNSLEEITAYLNEKSQDFISFKASVLATEAENDPIKKSETIRDMVVSISKIPDVIKREVYIKECSRIMDISEKVLFDTLAQIRQKERKDTGKKTTPPQVFDVVPSEKEIAKKVNVLYELERKIIELLLLYGTVEEEFEDLILETNEKGEIGFKPETVKAKVFEKIYLDLQDDEIEFANEDFRVLYYEIINKLNTEQSFQIDTFINELQTEKASSITDILMDEERYSLHDWESKEIYVKEKKHTISQIVSETILNLRRHLVSQKINELSEEIKTQEVDGRENSLQDIVDYITLKKVLSEKLNRVL
jgi:DNA primase